MAVIPVLNEVPDIIADEGGHLLQVGEDTLLAAGNVLDAPNQAAAFVLSAGRMVAPKANDEGANALRVEWSGHQHLSASESVGVIVGKPPTMSTGTGTVR